MKQESFDVFNKIGNMLFAAADHYYNIYINFDHSGHNGFACMALNESHERWHQGHCIVLFLNEFDKEPVVEAVDLSVREYATATDAVKSAYAIDGSILDAFEEGAKIIVEHDPVSIYKLGKMEKKLRREYNEVGDLVHRIESAPDRLGEIDAYLKAKYCPLVSGACHRH